MVPSRTCKTILYDALDVCFAGLVMQIHAKTWIPRALMEPNHGFLRKTMVPHAEAWVLCLLEPSAASRGCRAGPRKGRPGRPRLASSFRTLKPAVWHRLDAALTGPWSYIGARVPCKKADFGAVASIFAPPGRPWPGKCIPKCRVPKCIFKRDRQTTDRHAQYAYIMQDRIG